MEVIFKDLQSEGLGLKVQASEVKVTKQVDTARRGSHGLVCLENTNLGLPLPSRALSPLHRRALGLQCSPPTPAHSHRTQQKGPCSPDSFWEFMASGDRWTYPGQRLGDEGPSVKQECGRPWLAFTRGQQQAKVRVRSSTPSLGSQAFLVASCRRSPAGEEPQLREADKAKCQPPQKPPGSQISDGPYFPLSPFGGREPPSTDSPSVVTNGALSLAQHVGLCCLRAALPIQPTADIHAVGLEH